MEELERHRRSLAVAQAVDIALSGAAPAPAPATTKQQAEAITSAIDRCAHAGDLARWLLQMRPELADAVTLSSVQRIFDAGAPRLCQLPAPRQQPHLVPTLSFNALCRARTTLEDFSRFYLSYHGLHLEDFFRWLPLLVFVECSIYQLDEDNEALAAACVVDADSGAGTTEQALLGVLRSHALLDEHVSAQLAAGHRYWALERRLCARMGSSANVARVASK